MQSETVLTARDSIASDGVVTLATMKEPPADGVPGGAGHTIAGVLYLLDTTQPSEHKNPLGNKSQIARRAETLFYNLDRMIHRVGLEKCGFWTATFKDNLRERKEAQRRFNSFATHVLRKVFEEYIGVPERQQRGAIHYHLVTAVGVDIRSGFDFEAYKLARELTKAGYSGNGHWQPGYYERFKQAEAQFLASANPALKAIWLIIRKRAPRYGFGRCELIPIYSNAEACARYVGSYVTTQYQNRLREDKGMRTVRYGLKQRPMSGAWNWACGPAQKWRQGCMAFSAILGGVKDFTALFGSKWAFHFKEEIYLLTGKLPFALAFANSLDGQPLEMRIVAFSRLIAYLRGTFPGSRDDLFPPKTDGEKGKV